MKTYLHLLGVLLLIVIGSGCASTEITSLGARIESSILLENAGDFLIAARDGSPPYAVVRQHPNRRSGHLVELYDDSLHLRWSTLVPIGIESNSEPMMLMYGDEGISLVYMHHVTNDSVSIHGLTFDPVTGKQNGEHFLAGLGPDPDGKELGPNLINYSLDHRLFSFYRYDYSNLANDRGRTVGLTSTLFNDRLQNLGWARIEIPVSNEVDDESDARPYIQSYALADDGQAYQLSYHGTNTMLLTQIDMRRGTARSLDHAVPEVDFGRDAGRLDISTLVAGPEGEAIVAARQADGTELTALVLASFSFPENRVRFINVMKVTPGLAQRLIKDDEMENYWPRGIMRMQGGQIIVPLEQIHIVVRRDKQTGWTTTSYIHGDVAMMGFNKKGESIWVNLQERERQNGTSLGMQSSSWNADGDSLRYIYHSAEAEGLVAGATSVATGSLSYTSPLIGTSMLTLHHFTEWSADRSVMMVLTNGVDYRLVRLSY